MKKISIFIFAFLLCIPLCAKTYTLQEGISEAGKTLTKKLDGKVKNVAVMDIHTEYVELNDYICAEMTHEFVISFEQTSVVERNSSALKTIKKELAYQNSGEVSDDSIQSVGNSLGADCIIMGELKTASNGWQLNLKAVHVETKKVLASWNGIINKNDKNIQFQIKKASEKNKKERVQLVDPKLEQENIEFEGKKLKKVVSMMNSNLSYSDIVDVFIQRFGIAYVNDETYVVSTNFTYEESSDLAKRKGEYAWGVYATDDNSYTVLVTNVGCILLSRYYDDGNMYGIDSKYFYWSFPQFLFKAAVNYKAAGKSFSYEELIAFNEVLLGFENSSYYENYEKDYRPNIIDIAAMNYNTEGHGVTSKVFIEMCVKAGFDEGEHGSILHNAVEMDARDGGVELTKLLISLGIDINKKDEYGLTPLMRAIDYFEDSDDKTSQKCAELLIEAGADLNIKDDFEMTALMHAVIEKTSTKFLQYLITHGADVNAEDDMGNNVLVLAQRANNNAAVRVLKQAGAK